MCRLHAETLVRLLAPTTPFLAEALWQLTGGFGRAPSGEIHAGDADAPFGADGPGSIHAQSWPEWDEALARDETVTVAVQVNGKVRDRVEVAAGATEDVVRAAALERPRVREFVPDPDAARYHHVVDRLLSIVVAKG